MAASISAAAGLGVATATIALRAGGPISHAFGAGPLQSAYTIAFLLISLLPLAAIPGIARMHRDAGSAARTVKVASRA